MFSMASGLISFLLKIIVPSNATQRI